MTKPAGSPSVKVRARRQLLPMTGLLLCGVVTLGTAAAQIIPVTPPPPRAEIMRGELADIAQQRRDRIAGLRMSGSVCHPQTAHELVKLLVQDGQFDDARIFAFDYEQRCGDDPVVHRWGNAPRPKKKALEAAAAPASTVLPAMPTVPAMAPAAPGS